MRLNLGLHEGPILYNIRIADDPPEWTKAAVLELQFGDQLQEPHKSCALVRS